MKMERYKISSLFERYPALEACREEILGALQIWIECYRQGGKILLCGNGGSCADCDHIVGELMKGFLSKRMLGKGEIEALRKSGAEDAEGFAAMLQGSLPAISLPAQAAILSAFVNDVSADFAYAQLVNGYAKPEDVLVCISTSGNAVNCANAAQMAKAKGIRTVALTGQKESKLSRICDLTIRVPETETYRVQELHLPVYHALCAGTEAVFFPN